MHKMFVLCLIKKSSIIANHIGPDDNIDTSQENFLSNIWMRYAIHESIWTIQLCSCLLMQGIMI